MLAKLRGWWRRLPKNQRLLIGIGAPVAAGAALLTRRRTPTAAPVTAAGPPPGVFGAITPPEDFLGDPGAEPYDDSALYDALYGLESSFGDQLAGLQAGQASFFGQIGGLLNDFFSGIGGSGLGAAPGSTTTDTATASTSAATSGGFGGKVSTSGTTTQTAAAPPTASPVPVARTETVVTQTQQPRSTDYWSTVAAIAGSGVNTAAAQGVSTVSPTSGQTLVNFRGRMVTAEQYRQSLAALDQTAAQAGAQYQRDYDAVVAARTAPVSGLEASTTAPARSITRTNTTTGQTVSVGVGPSTTKTHTPRIE